MSKEFYELEVEINKQSSMYNVLIEEQYTKLKRINIPYLKELEERRIGEGARRYYDIIANLMSSFQNILNEEVKA